jgi:hypothetical protein
VERVGSEQVHVGFHLAAGIAADRVSSGEPVSMSAACVLAILSHWPIDDLNVGDAKLAHIVERFGLDARIVYWLGVAIGVLLAGVYAFLWADVWWKAGILLCCAISVDWEYLPRAFGLRWDWHQQMWFQNVLHSKWAFYIKLVVIILVALWVQPYV